MYRNQPKIQIPRSGLSSRRLDHFRRLVSDTYARSGVYFSACWAMAALLAWASDWASPCLPFCIPNLESVQCPGLVRSSEYTNLPFGETQIHLATALSLETGAFLERPAQSATGNGQVAVVAGTRSAMAPSSRGIGRHTSSQRLSRQQSSWMGGENEGMGMEENEDGVNRVSWNSLPETREIVVTCVHVRR